MMVLHDTAGRPVTLENIVARGGEGVVFTVRGRTDLIGKIYTPMPGEDREDKLRWMLGNPPVDPSGPDHASIAWPRDLLFDSQRRFLGFLMPYVHGSVSILRVFNPRSRAAVLPGFDRRYLYRSAHNLARALGALHRSAYYVGDLNESNVLVTPSALVTIIDTDSFQVQEPKNHRIIVYPCPVGKAEYTAPELQGRAFESVLRTWEHDAFALGVMIFQLLMDGNHPYRARWLGQGDPPPLSERVRRGYFPLRPPSGKGMPQRQPVASDVVAPAPGVPDLNSLHPALGELVWRCFVDGYQHPSRRPLAVEWEQGLSQAERMLVDCQNRHVYSGHLASCPTCGARPATRPTANRPRTAHSGPVGAQASAPRPGSGGSSRHTTNAGTAGPQGTTPPKRSSTGQTPPGPGGWDAFLKLLATGMASLANQAAQTQQNTTAAGTGPGKTSSTRARSSTPPGSGGASSARPGSPPRSGPSARSKPPAGASKWLLDAILGIAAAQRAQRAKRAQPTTSAPRAAGPGARAQASSAAGRASAPPVKLCRRCGYTNNADEIFCQRCSIPLDGTRPCPNCSKPMPANTLYCTNCSTRV